MRFLPAFAPLGLPLWLCLVVVVAGCLACGAAALGFSQGYKRPPLVISAVILVITLCFPLLAGLVENANEISFPAFCLLLYGFATVIANLILVPAFLAISLLDYNCRKETRLWHAGFMTSAWVLACVMNLLTMV